MPDGYASPYNTTGWDAAYWAYRKECISGMWGIRALGQTTQIGVLVATSADLFARTGQGLFDDA